MAQNLTRIFHFLALTLFALLFYYCMGLTGGEEKNLLNEYVYFKKDSVLINAFKIILAAALLFFIGKLYDRFLCKWNRNILLGIVCLFSFAFSVYWVGATNTSPVADQSLVCQYAVAFNRGDFSGLKKGIYIARYSQQLGLVTFLRGLFYLFGEYNYKAFQYFTAATVPLCVFSGCQILRKLTGNNKKTEMYYLLLMVCCFPMYGYVPFVYGDLCSTAIGLLSCWILLSCLERFSFPKAAALGITAGIAVQFRKNTLILVIAFCIVIVVKLIQKVNRQLVITGCCLLLGVFLMQAMVKGIYHSEWDKEAEEIPAFLYIVMGLNADNEQPGWHNGYEYHVFTICNDDPAAANARAMEDFKSYLNKYKTDPDYAVDFFIRKMNAQWNVPMYQCIPMNNNFAGDKSRLANSIYYEGRSGVLLRKFMKVYQLLLYGSILFWLITSRKEKISIEKYVLLIAVFGGFLFSMIWEAKTRYVFPYLLMMIPYYAIGMNAVISRLEQKLHLRS